MHGFKHLKSCSDIKAWTFVHENPYISIDKKRSKE